MVDNLSIQEVTASTDPPGFDVNGNFVQDSTINTPQFQDADTHVHQTPYATVLLSLLMQVWWAVLRRWALQKTTSFSAISGTGIKSLGTTGEIRSVAITVPTIPPGVSGIFGVNGYWKFGYGAFQYPRGNGPVRFINWQNCVLYPESHDATGFVYLLERGVNANISFAYLEQVTAPYLNILGGSANCNPVLDIWPGSV